MSGYEVVGLCFAVWALILFGFVCGWSVRAVLTANLQDN